MAETAKEMLERLRKKSQPEGESAAEKLARLRSSAPTVAQGRLIRDEQGSVIGNVPHAIPEPQLPKPTREQATRNRFAEDAIDTVAGVGREVTQTAMRANPILSSLMNVKDMGDRFDVDTPLSILDLPRAPSGRETVAGAKLAGNKAMGLLGPVPDMNFESALNRQDEIEAAQPAGSQMGAFVEDVGSLIALRRPFGAEKKAGGLFDDFIERKMAGGAASLFGKKGVAAQARDFLEHDTVKSLARATGRSMETGLEGYMLETIEGGNPSEVAALNAGMQLASSGALTLAKASTTLGIDAYEKSVPLPMRLAISAAVAGSMVQYFKSATPGGDDYSLESTESGYNKVLLALLGGVAAIGGKRSKEGGLLSNFPKTADAAWTIPRTAMINTAQQIQEATEAGDERAEKVITILQTSPDQFTPKQVEKMYRAMTSDDGSLPAVVAKLYRTDSKFRQLIDAPHPKLAGVPVTEETE